MPITRILDCLDACLDCPDDLRRTERSMGLTISGGEPMDQADELCRLLKHARTRFDDILVYTGYTLEELEACLPEDRLAFLKEHIDVLIDGPYIASLNNGKAVLRGSTNQTIRFLNPDMRCRYEHYLAGERDIQNLFVNDRLHSIGIQSPAGP
jgi:anaerobic ribonucleoside-triphosphate reductase activating protein